GLPPSVNWGITHPGTGLRGGVLPVLSGSIRDAIHFPLLHVSMNCAGPLSAVAAVPNTRRYPPVTHETDCSEPLWSPVGQGAGLASSSAPPLHDAAHGSVSGPRAAAAASHTTRIPRTTAPFGKRRCQLAWPLFR